MDPLRDANRPMANTGFGGWVTSPWTLAPGVIRFGATIGGDDDTSLFKNNAVWSGITFVVGFLVVFRTSQADLLRMRREQDQVEGKRTKEKLLRVLLWFPLSGTMLGALSNAPQNCLYCVRNVFLIGKHVGKSENCKGVEGKG